MTETTLHEAESGFEESDRNLSRSISFVPLLFLSIGTIIGSGWLFGVLAADSIAGPAAIISWVIGGVLMMLIALTYAEIAGMLPRSGGLVRYPYLTFGGFTGLLMGWAYLLASVTTAPIEAEGVITYIGGKFPSMGLNATSHGVQVLTAKGIGLAVVLILFFFIVNYFGVRFLAELNRWVVWWKLIIPTATFIFLFVLFRSSNFNGFSGGFVPYGPSAILQALPLSGVVFAFLGFRQAVDFGGEARNPRRDIPLAVVLSLVITTIIYVLLQIAFTGAVNFGAIGIKPGDWAGLSSSSWASAPFYDALSSAGIAALGAFATILLIDAAISPGGTGYIGVGASARNFYGMSVHESLPDLYKRTNRFQIPWLGLVTTAIVGVLFLAPVPSWYRLVGYVTDVSVLTYIMGGVNLLILRRTASDLDRPFKLPAANIIAPLGFLAALMILFWSGFTTLTNVLIIVFAGFALYTGYVAPRRGWINPGLGRGLAVLFLAVWVFVNAVGGWFLATGNSPTSGSISFGAYYALFAGTIIAMAGLTWLLCNDVGRKQVQSAAWLITLLLGTLLLVYFSEYGPLKSPFMKFPYPDLIEVGVGIVAYVWGVKSGYTTREMKRIIEISPARVPDDVEVVPHAAD